MEEDLKHLKTIAWVHYAFAGLNALVLLPVLVYVMFVRFTLAIDAVKIGILLLSGSAVEAVKILDGSVTTSLFVYSVSLMVGGFVALLLLAGLVSNFYCGKFMAEQKHYMFCLIVTALTITSFPIGTAVGVYSLIILLRPHVKELFENNENDRTPVPEKPLTLLSHSFVVYGLASFGWLVVPGSLLAAGLIYVVGDYSDIAVSYNSNLNVGLIAVSSLFIIGGLTLSACTVLAGRFIKSNSKYYFCFVIAVLNTLFAPFGTIIGLFAIHTLMKDAVRKAFFENNKGVVK